MPSREDAICMRFFQRGLCPGCIAWVSSEHLPHASLEQDIVGALNARILVSFAVIPRSGSVQLFLLPLNAARSPSCNPVRQ